jgi:hypothetical protein
MRQLSEAQELAINSVTDYSIDFRERSEEIDALEIIADMQILNATQFRDFADLGGLTVYFKEGALVAFYDYEMQCGTVFKDPVH